MISRVERHLLKGKRKEQDDYTASPPCATSSPGIPAIDTSRSYQIQHVKLPSLCAQVEEPDAHPDFESVIASFRNKSLPPSLRSNQNRNTIQVLDRPLPPVPTNYPSISLLRNNSRLPATSLPNAIESKEPLSTQSSPLLRSQYPLNPAQHLLKPRRSSGQASKRAIHFDVCVSRPAMIYAAAEYNVTTARHATNADPRGYLPVYEYQLLGQTLMIDMEDSYVFLPSISNLLGPSRANLCHIIESSAELQPYIRKIQGGLLKIQGLWVPLSIAKELARRVAWSIRFDLVPFFGYHFPTQCLSPNDPGFGDLRFLMGARRNSGSKKGSPASNRSIQLNRRATLPTTSTTTTTATTPIVSSVSMPQRLVRPSSSTILHRSAEQHREWLEQSDLIFGNRLRHTLESDLQGNKMTATNSTSIAAAATTTTTTTSSSSSSSSSPSPSSNLKATKRFSLDLHESNEPLRKKTRDGSLA